MSVFENCTSCQKNPITYLYNLNKGYTLVVSIVIKFNCLFFRHLCKAYEVEWDFIFPPQQSQQQQP